MQTASPDSLNPNIAKLNLQEEQKAMRKINGTEDLALEKNTEVPNHHEQWENNGK